MLFGIGQRLLHGQPVQCLVPNRDHSGRSPNPSPIWVVALTVVSTNIGNPVPLIRQPTGAAPQVITFSGAGFDVTDDGDCQKFCPKVLPKSPA